MSVTSTDPDDTVGIETRCILDPSNTPPTTFSALPSGCGYLGTGANVSGDGSHSIHAASQDSWGNQESTVRLSTFKVDATAPSVSEQGDSCSPVGANGWCRGK